jgi:hypothetical protein
MDKKWLMLLSVFAVIMYCCATEADDKTNRKSINAFVDYVRMNNQIDTAFFRQSFFSDTIRASKYKYGYYLLALDQFKPKIVAAKKIQIDKVDVNVVRMPEEYQGRIYTATFIKPSGRDSLFFIMEGGGIESFVVMRKGDTIISW